MANAWTINDIISPSTLLSILDYIASAYDSVVNNLGNLTGTYSVTLNQTGVTASSPAVGSTLTLSAIPTGMPVFGTLLLTDNYESIQYAGLNTTAKTVTILSRGVPPQAHATGATALIPISTGSLFMLCDQVLIGNGTSTYGLGSTQRNVIEDMLQLFDSQLNIVQPITGSVIQTIFSNIFQAIEKNIINKGKSVLTGIPSFSSSSFIVNNLITYLQYYNDQDTGTSFGNMILDSANRAYWIYSGGNICNGKTVIPPVTTLMTYVQGGTNTYTTGLNRWAS
ncbi:MAG: hypothetical protein KGI08_10605, partial [Thaumarchaeota archaeon]|nr:hypothetical protein [Nitrososphaerota archaeon]